VRRLVRLQPLWGCLGSVLKVMFFYNLFNPFE